MARATAHCTSNGNTAAFGIVIAIADDLLSCGKEKIATVFIFFYIVNFHSQKNIVILL